jgi:hypothetical protein
MFEEDAEYAERRRKEQEDYLANKRRKTLSAATSWGENGYVMRDWLGNTYRVGSTVIWPRSLGRSVEMSKGKVERIWLAIHNYEDYRAQWKEISIEEAQDASLSDMIEWRVRIDPDKEGSRFGRWEGPWDAEPDKRTIKKATIINIESITAMDFELREQ